MVDAPPVIIGLMLSSNNCEGDRCYSKMVQACKDTWIKSSPSNVKTYMIYGDAHKSHLLNGVDREEYIITEENEIIVNTRESRENLLKKTIKSIEFCLENHPDLDFIFRPNCGSYINTHILSEFLKRKPKHKLYCGIYTSYKDPTYGCFREYASGSCILMSKDVARLILERENELQYNGNILIDDVSIGDFLIKNGINLDREASRIDVYNENELHNNFDPTCYHYYFRHTINPNLIYECHRLFNGTI